MPFIYGNLGIGGSGAGGNGGGGTVDPITGVLTLNVDKDKNLIAESETLILSVDPELNLYIEEEGK